MRIFRPPFIILILSLVAGLACKINVGDGPLIVLPTPTPLPSLQDIVPTVSMPGDTTAAANPEAPTPVPTLVVPLEPAIIAPAAAAPELGILKVDYLGDVPPEQINTLQSKFYPASNQTPARYSVARYQIRFRSFNENGRVAPIRAEIFIPRVGAPSELPVLIYGAGTSGIGNNCAPLDEAVHGRNWGDYQVHMLSYAGQGLISMLPHWHGYDDRTRTHLYFIARMEATIMLDATRAAYNFFATPPSDIQARPAQAVFFGGYSQGGHGALAGLDLAAQYAPELPIKGVIGHATAPNVEALLRERPPLAPYIVYSYLNYYGGEIIDPAQVFLPNWLPTFYADASTKCVDEAYEYYPADPTLLYQPAFLDALYTGQLGERYPLFKAALDQNQVGGSVETSAPLLLLHGAADTVVTPATIDLFIGQLCNLGKNVNYKFYPDINHFQTRQYGFVDTLTWMQAVLAGTTPESGCSEFFNSKFE